MQITGAELVIKALKMEQVDKIFAYPGGQVIDLFDALYNEKDIEVILPRHEQGLIHAADGYARSTGKVGVCLVTSGPGATNLVTGIATANYDSVPIVCFTGQVPINLLGKDAFQEVDITSVTKSICKYAVTVFRREDLGMIIKKAFHIAKDGKPGVVVVDLPKDVQKEPGSCVYPPLHMALHENTLKFESERLTISKQITVEKQITITKQIKKAVKLLRAAKKPLFLIGGGVKIAGAEKELHLLVEKTRIPVVTTIMGKGAIPTSHELYVGNLGIHGSAAANFAVNHCDILFAIGTRFNDRITGKISTFAKDAMIIHLDIDQRMISRNVVADIPIVADAKIAIEILQKEIDCIEVGNWLKQIQLWKEKYPIALHNRKLNPQMIFEKMNKVFSDVFFVTDVGQNQLWATQFLELNEQKQMLTSGGFGTMGYGLPAAIGAKIGNPKKDVVVISGDGGMQMNIQEMATAVVYELPLIICIINNGYLGNVRQWQEMFYDRRYSGTCMRFRKSCLDLCHASGNRCFGLNHASGDCCPKYVPDFIQMAYSYGAKGIRVTRPQEIEFALTQAKKEKKAPTVIEFVIDCEENVLPIVPPGNPLEQMIK